ncbi:MAG TPA: hypothetical protein VLF91_04550 [Candidatus Saccharimonadales bacterium]|nr:hypothetical protein [Candidatus Saccharimonadales bacterium]
MNDQELRQRVAKAQELLGQGRFPASNEKFLAEFYKDYRTLFRAYAKDFAASKSEAERKALMRGMVEIVSLAHLQIVLESKLPDDLRESVLDYDHHPDEYPGYETRERRLLDRDYAVLKQE